MPNSNDENGNQDIYVVKLAAWKKRVLELGSNINIDSNPLFYEKSVFAIKIMGTFW